MSCDLLARQLYDICQAQNCTFLKIKNNNFILLFRRRLTPALLDRWTAVQQLARNVPVSDGAIWCLTPNKCFSTKSIYQVLARDISGSHNK
jgi:hypothetical protein